MNQTTFPATPEDEKLARAVLYGRQVLIVEDESLVSLMVEDMLRDLGCQIAGVAASPKAALAALARRPAPDAVVVDLNLEGGQSYGLLDALVAQRVPFVITTGYGEDGVAEAHCHRPILRKPFLETDLVRALARALSAAEARSPEPAGER